MNALRLTLCIACCLSLACLAAASPPPLSDKDARQFEVEKKDGAKFHKELLKSREPKDKFSADAALVARVNAVGQKLTAVADETSFPADFGHARVYPFAYQFFVIDNPDINAFSVPGGYIYVDKGLLDIVRTDEELAAVLAHEVMHAAHHHVPGLEHQANKMQRQMTAAVAATVAVSAATRPSERTGRDIGNVLVTAQAGQLAVFNLRYSQAAERDADRAGMRLMQAAGYSPVGMLTLMQLFDSLEKRGPQFEWGIFRTHPYGPERIAAVRASLDEMKIAANPASLRRISGRAVAIVQATADGARELRVGDKRLALLADAARAQAAADRLNARLDTETLALYQVRADGPRVLAGDETLLELTGADAALRPGATPESLAVEAAAALRVVLWAQTLPRARSVSP